MDDKVMHEQAAREQLLAYVKRLKDEGLTAAQTGNMSLRTHRGLLITPTGVPYETLTVDDLVYLTADGKGREGELAPSSEWHFHCAIYRQKPEVNAVVHTHSNGATALACLGEAIPAFHYMVALFGGNEVPCTGYATFGTEALSDVVIKGLDKHSACLLGNHGAIVTADSLPTAYQRAVELESLAQQYLLARQVGSVKLLSDAEMQEAQENFSCYGQK